MQKKEIENLSQKSIHPLKLSDNKKKIKKEECDKKVQIDAWYEKKYIKRGILLSS